MIMINRGASEPHGVEIWVKAGTYLESLTITNSYVTLFAGFAGTESSRDQRNWANNVTIIDGGQTGRVVRFLSSGSRANALDGFKIAGGNIAGVGGGVLGDGSTITNGPDYFPTDPYGLADYDCDGKPDTVNGAFSTCSAPPLQLDLNNDPLGAFRVWAPNASSAAVRGDFNGWGTSSLTNEGNGFWSGLIANVQTGQQYKFFLSGASWKQNPLARQLKSDDHNSVVQGTNAFNWTDGGFVPPARNKLIIYQLHIGGFNRIGGAAGTFRTATNMLDYIAGLGVNAVKVMPVWEFDTSSSWGYNPVNPYAIERDYGTPDEFKTFVNACHAKGLAVILDVVYNHLVDLDAAILILATPAPEEQAKA